MSNEPVRKMMRAKEKRAATREWCETEDGAVLCRRVTVKELIQSGIKIPGGTSTDKIPITKGTGPQKRPSVQALNTEHADNVLQYRLYLLTLIQKGVVHEMDAAGEWTPCITTATKPTELAEQQRWDEQNILHADDLDEAVLFKVLETVERLSGFRVITGGKDKAEGGADVEPQPFRGDGRDADSPDGVPVRNVAEPNS